MAMEALVSYYRGHEAEIPDFSAAVRFGSDKPLAEQAFKGRSATAATKSVPMQTLLASGPAGASRDLTFAKTGTGRLFYVARLKYAVDAPRQQGLDSGFAITRKYEPTEAGAKGATGPAAMSYKAGDLVRVTLSFDLTKERRYVAVVDPLPAGFEPVESWFATTARDLAGQNDDQNEPSDWWLLWEKGGFDHVEKFDDQVRLFATRLGEGHHEFAYIVRATTAGTYSAAPAHVGGNVRAGGVRSDRDGGDRREEVRPLIARAAAHRAPGNRGAPRVAAAAGRGRRRGHGAARRGVDPPGPAAGRSARRGRRGALDDGPRSQRRSAVRGAFRPRHARDAVAARSAAAGAGRGDAGRRGSPVPLALGRRSDRDGARHVAQRHRPRSRRGRLDADAAGRQAAARSTRAARRGHGAAPWLGREDRRGGRGAAPRASAVEGRDPGALPEPRALRQPDRRRRTRQPRLLRQRQLDADAGPGGVPGGAAAASVALQPVAQPGAGDRAPAGGAGADGAARLAAAGRGGDCPGRAAPPRR